GGRPARGCHHDARTVAVAQGGSTRGQGFARARAQPKGADVAIMRRKRASRPRTHQMRADPIRADLKDRDRLRSRRRLLVVMATAGLVAAAAGISIALRPERRPNVLLITIDTLRADHLGSYGNRNAQTPVLDALSKEGTRFAEVV